MISGGSSRLRKKDRVPLRAIAKVTVIAAGVQYGWALQLSLLTPYVLELGISHTWSSYIWLCGPISGLVVQPIVGHYSDVCTSKFGRRRPFILVGVLCCILSILLISFSSDLGWFLGDSTNSRPWAIFIFIIGFWILDLSNNAIQGPCRALLADFTGKDVKRSRKANGFFSAFIALGNILGYGAGSYSGLYELLPFTYTEGCGTACANLKSAFLIGVVFLIVCTFVSLSAVSEKQWSPQLDQTSSTTPILSSAIDDRASESKTKSYNSFYPHSKSLSFDAIDIPYTESHAANSQSIDATLISKEESEKGKKNEQYAWIHENDNLKDAITHEELEEGKARNAAEDREREKGRGEEEEEDEEEEEEEEEEEGEEESKFVLVELFYALCDLPTPMWMVLLVTALTWFAWFPFTLYDTDWVGREIYHGSTDGDEASVAAYYAGVSLGCLGLVFNSVVLGLTSLYIEPLCKKLSLKHVWAYSNFILSACFVAMLVVSHAEDATSSPSLSVRAYVVLIFSLLGVPLAITYSVPYSLTANLTSSIGGGQGLSMGILNLAIVIPQMIISLTIGPWDSLFGGGNLPGFFLATVFSALGGIAAFYLPKPPPEPAYRLVLSRSRSLPTL